MAQLGAKARAQLPDTSFAYIDSKGRRRLPIHDEAHVRNALARFDRVDFDDDEARSRARSRLLRAAKRYKILPVGFIDGQLRPERNLPKGRVALLLADVEDSTGLLTELGDRWPPVLNELRRILRAETKGDGGHEVDARADEYLAAFGEPSQALAAAVAMQRAIGRHAWADRRAVRVRIGVHAGRPSLNAAGYVGIAVNTVARICDAGHGGQIIVSAALRDAIELQDGLELRALGRHRLRGIPDEHELFQVMAAGLPRRFPPLRTMTPPVPTRLPHGGRPSAEPGEAS
ncbi:MAG: adenylate/guanylate cyclase domain-containing protein [Chloroflexi bacterium]|nr:adenylate/guanylate cyclase domain-containing protein [Chloroflexota bacterium]